MLWFTKDIFLGAKCPSYDSAVRKQWPLYSNDAVSIFQSWQGGQTSGIIVLRPTGCPEEEVSAELYASIQGQGGAWQGGLNCCVSSLSVSSRVSLERGAASATQDAMTLLCYAIGGEFTINQLPLTWIEFAVMKRKWKHKNWKAQKLELCRAYFPSNWFGLLRFSGPSY